MKCERCGKELSGLDLYCERCGKAVFPEYMDEADIWAYYKTDEELAEILKAEEGQETKAPKKSLWEAALLKEQETEAESLEPESESETEVSEPEISEAELESEVLEPDPESEEIEVSESELSEPKQEVPEPETKPEPEISEEEPEPEVPELEVMSEAEVLEPDAEPEVETEPDTERLETAQEETEEKEPQEETEDISEQEEWDFNDDDDEEEDGVSSLTPEMKKARRWKRGLISLFLILCLGAGIFLGFHRIKKMEQQEKEYYKNIEGNTKQEEVSNEVPAEIPEEEKDTEPSEEETPVAAEPQEEPKEEPKQEYFKLVNADEIDFSKYQKLPVASTEENSVKESESYDYSAKSAVDGDVSTSWQENEEGVGEGKGFQMTLDGAHRIRYVVLHLGNWRSDQLWDYNARPKTLTIQVGDQQVKDVEFSNEKKKFCLSFDEPVEASYISLYIKEAYEGSRWQDNCISEVELYE